uniref:Histone-like protein n=1 Tax=Lingulaulax polyedra TaxID=160621 RepID=Q84U55_LINPO|nr:histone-like protein [Lingulodinium polyedra]|mmetsp:Transcript_121250/g.368692  ORF Transcript_121250/g.368692 Transcript_121250/m.368692 type:complete len:105 (+) Transcript_121250:101-415(+)
MAPMKAAAKKAMTKGAIADALATQFELKKTVCGKLINSLAEIATKEVKSSGVFTIPGVCKIKTRTKPATKAGKREIFGKTVVVKAKPARKVVKAFPVAALKKSI